MCADASPLVSIITPSFNQGPFIEATIRSVLEQDYPQVEYIVMDGGSTDQTLDILRRYEGQLTWVSQKDAGQADAINKGIARSRGQIVTWLNSDDTYTPGAISAAVEYFQSHPEVALVYGDADFIDPQGNFIAPCPIVEPPSRRRLRLYSDYIVQPASFFRRNAFDAVGGLDASLHYSMDYDLWLKLSARYEMAYLPRTLAHYRWFGQNKSAVGGRERLDEVRQLARRHGLPGLPAYFVLEEIRMHLADAAGQARSAHLIAALPPLARATTQLLTSPRALLSLFSPQTWRIIRTGRLLRAVRAPDSEP